ncbi:MAG: SIS domain-containing protein [Erysipelotrichaceae bacterium]|nr:SIS domain-containing protein [Erysipelotrichaceae bacterium]
MNSKDLKALEHYVSNTEKEVISTLKGLDIDALNKAANLIRKAEKNGNRVHVSGIGKPGHIAGYIASLLSSTGTPSYFLHGTEAVHGSCGQLCKGDVVIFISNSGETSEMKATIQAIKNNECDVIGVSGNKDSWLAKQSKVHLLAHVDEEGGPLNRAPRASILSETIVLQALSTILQSHENIDPKQYVKWHPGGSLGQLRENEK